MQTFLVNLSFFVAFSMSTLPATGAMPPAFDKAWNLISTYSGAENALQQAEAIAVALKAKYPSSGYFEVLQAQRLATWELDRGGFPVLKRAMELVDEALELNPNLPQAYAVRARLSLEASKLPEALQDAEKALQLDPESADAMIVRADIARAARERAVAEEWYLKFIEVAPNDTRKSNGYGRLAQTYVDAWQFYRGERPALIAKATAAYEAMVQLDPKSPWKMVNYAAFLNNEAGDFDAAEQYARRTLTLRDFPAARRQLAMAQYQKLTVKLGAMSDQALVDAVGRIFAATSVSIEQVARANGTGGAALERLQPLRTRLSGSDLYQPEPSR